MKINYIKPESDSYRVATEGLLCESVTKTVSNESFPDTDTDFVW